MNVIGEDVEILGSPDPSIVGRSGKVLMESEKTLLLETSSGRLRVAKKGGVFRVIGREAQVDGSELVGKLEDRWGR
jgi:RNase P/RNase MRP subunit p29